MLSHPKPRQEDGRLLQGRWQVAQKEDKKPRPLGDVIQEFQDKVINGAKKLQETNADQPAPGNSLVEVSDDPVLADLKERQRKEEETGKKPGGGTPKQPKTGPENSDVQANLTDPDARIMRKNKRAGFTESYNAQAAVDADGSQLIVGEHVSQSASDSTELENGINSIPEEIGKPKAGLLDAGYVDGDAIERVEESGIELFVSVHREDAHSERNYDYRPKKQSERPIKAVKDPRLLKMREKLRSEEGKARYAKRNHTVETAFGIIKEVMGFRGFMLRGLEKVKGEWTLVCLSYNLKRLHRLKAS